MMLRKYEILREDVADIAGLSLARINVLCATVRGFPKPTRRDGSRTIYDARQIRRYFETRIDGRTIEGRARKTRRRK